MYNLTLIKFVRLNKGLLQVGENINLHAVLEQLWQGIHFLSLMDSTLLSPK